jgi:hypothetical protein
MKIACVCPTIRQDKFQEFVKSWKREFSDNNVRLVPVLDGKNPVVLDYEGIAKNGELTAKDIMGEYADTIYNFNDGVRNLGFAYVAKYLPEVETIISLDDDTSPCGNTIQDHLNALDNKVSVSWMSTATEYTRGYPYGVREEAEVVLSHGVWDGVADWDAPTQLINGNPEIEFYREVIPKGVLFPLCAMNFAFKRKLLPYIYQAPMFGDINRFADIWGGIECKRDIDKLGWAVVTGCAKVYHQRASNVFDNLIKEVRGLKMNEVENYGKGEYFKLFFEKRKKWQEFIRGVSK